MSDMMLISDAAKEVNVENHVLRYWEEELHLPIKRNELGHRYYTQEDVERFKQIKGMKERGLQLKAIKMVLKNGNLDVISQAEQAVAEESIQCRSEVAQETPEDKSRRLQWLLKQLIRETLQENNRELSREIKESIIKEMDYQFRMQEEREEEREHRQTQRSEEYYKRMDELLCKKSRRTRVNSLSTRDAEDVLLEEKKTKKKRHSIF